MANFSVSGFINNIFEGVYNLEKQVDELGFQHMKNFMSGNPGLNDELQEKTYLLNELYKTLEDNELTENYNEWRIAKMLA